MKTQMNSFKQNILERSLSSSVLSILAVLSSFCSPALLTLFSFCCFWAASLLALFSIQLLLDLSLAGPVPIQLV